MENEMNSVMEMNKSESMRSEVALRCAKAAILLSTLRHCYHCPNSTESTATATDDEGGEVWELKKELVKEKVKNKKMRMCSVGELFLQITILLSLWTLSLLIAFDFL